MKTEKNQPEKLDQNPEDKTKNPSRERTNEGSQYEIKNDGQAGLSGEAMEKQNESQKVRYDSTSLSDGGTWGGVTPLLHNTQNGFGL